MTDSEKKDRIRYVESLLTENGAIDAKIQPRGQGKDEKRTIFWFNGNYYRLGEATFDGIDDPYIVVSCTDTKKYAEYGLFDDVHAFEYTLSDEETKTEIRFAMGIEDLFTS
jgi:hypothetical protein